MSIQPPLPKAEAKVQVLIPGRDWKDSLDFDPVMLPVEDTDQLGGPHTTDVFDACVLQISEDMHAANRPNWQHRLVWSATEQPVLGTCPDSDDLFPIDEGVPIMVEDQGPGVGGVAALGCGCRDEDA